MVLPEHELSMCSAWQGNRRETRLLGILNFVHTTVWKSLFGKVRDSLCPCGLVIFKVFRTLLHVQLSVIRGRFDYSY